MGIGTVFARMAICRLKRGAWLAGLGYRQSDARALADGDMLILQLDDASPARPRGTIHKSMTELPPAKGSDGKLRWSDGSLARRGHGSAYLQPTAHTVPALNTQVWSHGVYLSNGAGLLSLLKVSVH